MMQAWKTQHIVKGLLTRVPLLDRWRQRRAATGGSGSARYCYSVWLRHLSVLGSNGFRVKGAEIGELGPGDSIGTGLAALLSGAEVYAGLDIVPFSTKASLLVIFEELVRMYLNFEGIPNDEELARVRPKLDSYAFPHELVDCSDLATRAEKMRQDLCGDLSSSRMMSYRVPWSSPDVIKCGSLDLIFSQAVLEHVDALDKTYLAMSSWLKPGGYASHVIDFGAHHLSPFWNGHWAYKDVEWRLVRGRREFLLNREPLSTHLECARKAGFEIVQQMNNYDHSGLPQRLLASRFQQLGCPDSHTRGTVLILRKPHRPSRINLCD
jgi:SAM-dependent methyltransferase